jgi:hypothetical protein
MLKEIHAKYTFAEIISGSRSNCIPNPETRQVDFEEAQQSKLFSIDICFLL